MAWDILRLRDSVHRAVRSFFSARGFIEIDAPLLTPFPTLDANIRPLQTEVSDPNGKKRMFFLHASPEHAMKKLLCAGAERIFSLGKVFRDGELTPFHNPEFTMVEWYRTGTDYRGIEQDTEDLVAHILRSVRLGDRLVFSGRDVDLSPPWNTVTVSGLFEKMAGVDLARCQNEDALFRCAERLGLRPSPDDGWDMLFFRIFLEKIEPDLGFPKPVFVEEYPARMGLMAKAKAGDPRWVERTELYIAGLELANGYTELTDPDEQRKRFQADLNRKIAEGLTDLVIDEELLEALELGLPPCAGIALGLDRLIMLLLDKRNIEEVMPFPMHPYMA